MNKNLIPYVLLGILSFATAGFAQVRTDVSDNLQEVVSKRDMHSKHYLKPNGEMVAYINAGPVHYKDENNNWSDIQTKITPNSGDFAGQNLQNSLQSSFPANFGAGQGVLLSGAFGEVLVGMHPSLKAISESGDLLMVLENSQTVAPSFSEETASYQNVFSIADVEFIVDRGAVKNNVILNSIPANLPTNAEFLSYSETIQVPEGWTIETNWLNGTNLTAGSLRLLDQSGNVQLTVPVPDIYEQLDPSKTIHADGLWETAYKIESLGDGLYELSTLVPLSWLLDNNRNFPIVIDPTVTLSGISGGWLNSSGSLNDNGFYVYILNNGSTEYRAWTRFNLSTIPNDAIIQNSEINMYLNGAGDANTHTIYVNDVTSGQYGTYGSYNSTAYADFATGNYTSFNVTGTTNSYYGWTDLGSGADSDIEASLTSDNFQLAFTKSSSSSDTYRRFTATSNQLRITYIQCTGQLGGTISASALNSFGFHLDCQGDSTATITTTASGGSTYTYAWSGPNGFAATTSGLTNVAAGTYYVSISSGTICPAELDIEITEPDTLMIDATLSNYSGFGVTCFDGNDGTISVSTTGSSGSYTYSWTGPNSFSSTSSTLSTLERGWYYVTVTESNASCSQADSIKLTSPNPLYVTLSNLVKAFCEGEATGSAQAAGAGGIQAYSFAWSNGETGPNAVALINDTHTVSITDYLGCESSSDFVIGFKNPAAVVSLGGPDTGYCKDGQVLLNAGGGFQSYVWSTGAVGQLLQVNTMGTFTVTVTNFGGCSGSASINVNQEFDLPTPNLGANISTPLSSVVLDPGVYKNYLWSTGSFSPTIAVSTAGTYTVTVTDFRDCKGSDDIKVSFWPQGLSEIGNGQSWSIFPNPAFESITLVSLASISDDIDVSLYNAAGEVVLRKQDLQQGMVKESIDVSGFASGVYLIKVNSAGSNWSASFIKN
jgi:hypothetical protein